MPVKQQENFREMTDHVLSIFPHYPPQLAHRRINNQLRSVIARRNWSGITKYAILEIPDSYSTGTVDLTNGSKVVDGTGTSWDVSTVVNTTLSAAIDELGVVDITPVAMTGIRAGQWVLIDGGNAGEEVVFVIETSATKFRAEVTATHAGGVTVQVSTLAGRQLRIDNDNPFYTVTAVSSTTRALLDKEWKNATTTGESYSISLVFTDLGVRDLKMLVTMVNQTRRWQMTTYMPKEVIDYSDPHRSLTQSTYLIVDHETDPGGAPLFELYPRPTSQQVFPFLYVQQWSELEKDLDILPNGIRSDVIVNRVLADAYRWPRHKVLDGGIYYDPAVAKDMMRESELELEEMEREDDSTYVQRLMWSYKEWPFGGFGAEWHQSHDLDGFLGVV
jgi:hypothetical protein